jgi:hypothetical protein
MRIPETDVAIAAFEKRTTGLKLRLFVVLLRYSGAPAETVALFPSKLLSVQAVAVVLFPLFVTLQSALSQRLRPVETHPGAVVVGFTVKVVQDPPEIQRVCEPSPREVLGTIDQLPLATTPVPMMVDDQESMSTILAPSDEPVPLIVGVRVLMVVPFPGVVIVAVPLLGVMTKVEAPHV